MLAVVASAFDGKAAIHSTPSVAEARAAIRRTRYDAALLDVGMIDGCGTDPVAPLCKRTPSLPVALFTPHEVDGAPQAGTHLLLDKSRDSRDPPAREVTHQYRSLARDSRGDRVGQ